MKQATTISLTSTHKPKKIIRKAMTPRQASQTYGISEGTLANMRHQKTGPKYYKIGKRKVIYFVEDFEAWLRKNPVLTIDSLPEKM